MKLVIAEKPSVAQSIARVIGATGRKDGYLKGNQSNKHDLTSIIHNTGRLALGMRQAFLLLEYAGMLGARVPVTVTAMLRKPQY